MFFLCIFADYLLNYLDYENFNFFSFFLIKYVCISV